MEGIPLDELGTLSFEAYQTSSLIKNLAWTGVDLAIIKFEEPLELPSSAFPKFMESEHSYSDTYGLSVGFGPQKFNNQKTGPKEATTDPLDALRKHVFSCKVSEKTFAGHSVFAGNYKGKLVNGDESFIPNENMMKTEGLPVNGDSGSPLFVKDGDDKYRLVGVCSRTLSANSGVITTGDIREMLSENLQFIFPLWTDIRPLLPWIRQHMGKP